MINPLSYPELISQDTKFATEKKQMEFQLTSGPPVKSILYPLDLQHIVMYDCRLWRFHRKSTLFIPGIQKTATKTHFRIKSGQLFTTSSSEFEIKFLFLQQILFMCAVSCLFVFLRGGIYFFLLLIITFLCQNCLAQIENKGEKYTIITSSRMIPPQTCSKLSPKDFYLSRI